VSSSAAGHSPPQTDRVLVSLNPKAGRRSVALEMERTTQLLVDQGFVVDIVTDLGTVAEEANHLHGEKRLRALIAVGGDGTIAELANRTHPGVPLTIFPSGTSNLLARQLGFEARPEAMVETILRGKLVAIDAGSASGKLFLLMIGCGFDAEVVARVHALRDARRGGHLSYWSYIKPILQSIRSYKYPEIRICGDEDGAGPAGHAPPIVARWAFVFNLPRYGWGLRLAPESDCRDGLLELYAFLRGSLWHGLRYAAWTQIGRHARLKDCIRRPVRRLRITSEQPVAYQLDGDPGGVLPVEIEVVPGRVTMLMPPSGPSGW